MKRLVDIISSFTALILLSPFMVIISLIIIYKIGRPVFFIQPRPGINGKNFMFIKFRSMKNTRNDNGMLLSDENRMTKIGNTLRNYSLDEIPSFWNVLRGDMSLVGPRPLLVEYLPLYSIEQARRHDVKPGITGWAQINGRNMLTWEEKFELDIWYVDNRTFFLDLKILILTVGKVIRRDGISSQTNITMEKFTGGTSI
jgi:sugar transferase EpsL